MLVPAVIYKEQIAKEQEVKALNQKQIIHQKSILIIC